jgi:hypothetical protein
MLCPSDSLNISVYLAIHRLLLGRCTAAQVVKLTPNENPVLSVLLPIGAKR